MILFGKGFVVSSYVLMQSLWFLTKGYLAVWMPITYLLYVCLCSKMMFYEWKEKGYVMLQLGFEKTLKTLNWYRLPFGLYNGYMYKKWRYNYENVMKRPACLI